MAQILRAILSGTGCSTRVKFTAMTAAFLVLASGNLRAQSTTADQEVSQAIKAPNALVKIGTDLFGDKVNLFTGSLEFVQTDVSLPGNNRLPVSIGRRIVTGTTKARGRPFGTWDLDIPHLHGVFSKKDGWVTDLRRNNRCSNFSAPTAFQDSTGWEGQDFWQGNYIYVPGAGDQPMLLRASDNTRAPGPVSNYPVVTKEFWNFSCVAALKNDSTGGTLGEGFLAIAPDGTAYRFDQMVSYDALSITKKSGLAVLKDDSAISEPSLKIGDTAAPSASAGTASLPRVEVWLLPTEVADRFGNWVRYGYDTALPGNLTSITSSDGRAISITYGHPSDPKLITEVTDGTRIWTYTYSSYAYSGDVYFALDAVVLPDASTWQLGGIYPLIYKMGVGYGTDGCDAQFFPSGTPVGSMVHPTGAAGTFTLQGQVHGRSDVPYNCSLTPTGGRYNPRARYFYTLSLVAKSISGPSIDAMTWRYAYGLPNASWSPCEAPCPTSKTVSVTDPNGDVTRYTYGNRFRVSEGRIEQVDYGWNGASALRTVKTRYRPLGAGPYPVIAGLAGENFSDSEALARFMPADQIETTQQGVVFAWTANAFDDMARATNVTRSSSLGMSRSEITTYSDNAAKWVLGQVAAVTERLTNKRMIANVYHPTTATLTSVSHFGHVGTSMTYYGDGTVETRKDGKNQATRFSNYKRGIPQNVSYPDASAESAVVENIGVVSAMTNQAGFTTRFGFDTMGRLASITPPADPGMEWNPTIIEFGPLQSSEFGVDAGHWRQTVTTGKGVTSTYFDALWRPVLAMSYDAADFNNTSQVVKRAFDGAGRTSFDSYPFAYGGNPDIGVRTKHDALGRPVEIRADSELGELLSRFSYGDGFTKIHTDARGHSSTSHFQVFDAPSEDAVIAIAAPLSLNVAIARDTFGKPLAVTRSGDGASATRRYVYDQFERLCKTIEPETGGELVDYDAANNLAWRAPGSTLTSAVCDRANVASASKISFNYDPMHRLKNTSFGDGASAISRTYTADGLPWQVSSGGATWTMTYNHRRQPLTQVLNFGGQNYTLGTAYNANGHVSQLQYPSENNPIGVRSIAYAPDALGRPSQVGSFATGIRYYANGAVAGFTYGNGRVHTMTQNARKLPERSTDSGVMQDRYSYDQNANVLAIADEFQGIGTRAMGYDALDRLETANAPGMWGAARYTYDVLDNIRTSTVGNRTSSYQYGPRNLLDNLSSTSPSFGFNYSHDARGNVIQRGNQAFDFDLGNRLKSAPNRDTYVYDGFGRRVQTTAVDGTVTISVYSPAGQLLFTKRSGGPNPAAHTEYIYLHQHQIAEVKR